MAEPLLPQPSNDWALFLDFDGSIVELAATPDAVHVDDGLLKLLVRLQAGLGGAVAIISGRPIDQLDAYLAPHRFPAAGFHGLERRHDDATVETSPAPNEHLRAIARELQNFSQRHPGVLVEDKGATIALHYRQAPQFGDACREIVHELVDGWADNLGILAGKMVYEVKPADVDKGRAATTSRMNRLLTSPMACAGLVFASARTARLRRDGGSQMSRRFAHGSKRSLNS